jgi:hypothetical protein
LTFFVKHMQSDRGATLVFNAEDSTITCSCQKFEFIGMYTIHFKLYIVNYNIGCLNWQLYLARLVLCKDARRVFNMNGVYNLLSQYILPRWTKYVKSRLYIEK